MNLANGGQQSTNGHSGNNGSYSVTFRIGYQTDMGQSVAIVGNIEELGNWKQFKANMKWTDGHVWVLENVPISVPYF